MINDFGLRKEGFKSRSGRSRSLRRGEEEQHESEQITSSLCQIFGVPHLQVSGKSFGNASLCSLGTNCRYCTRSGWGGRVSRYPGQFPAKPWRRFLHNSSFFASRGSRTPDMTRATAAIACLLVCAAHGGVVCVAAVKPGLRIPPLTASCSGSTKRRCFFSTWPSTLNPLVLRYMRVAERPFQTLVHVVAGTTRG